MPILTGNSNIRTPQYGVVKLYSTVVAGSSAIASQTASSSSGFVVTRNDVGDFTITFTDKWDHFVNIHGVVYDQGTARGESVEIKTKYASSTKTLSFFVVSDAGAAEDLTSGDELYLEVTMSNTLVGPPT